MCLLRRKLEELTGFNYDNNDIHNYDNTVLQKNLENCDKSSIMVNDYLIRFINVFLRKSVSTIHFTVIYELFL